MPAKNVTVNILVFRQNFIKGYEFDREKLQPTCCFEDFYHESYIGSARGRLPRDPVGKLRIILVLDCGDDYEELKSRKVGNVDSWFEQVKATILYMQEILKIILKKSYRQKPRDRKVYLRPILYLPLRGKLIKNKTSNRHKNSQESRKI